METKIVNFEDDICKEIVLNGDVLAFPTETVFGFGIRYDDEKAYQKLCLLKKRPSNKPYTVMVSKKEDIANFTPVDNRLKKIIDKFMPGEITLICKAKENLPYQVTLNGPTIGIRIAALKEVPLLIEKVGIPMLVTSANISNEPPLLDSESCYEQFKGLIPAVVKGKCFSKTPSTIVDVSKSEIKLIRQGKISFEEIKKVWEM